MKIEKAVKLALLQFREKRGELKTGKRKEWNKKNSIYISEVELTGSFA